MVERIREEFKSMLEELDWMDPEVGGYGGEDQGSEGDAQDHAEGAGLDGSCGKKIWWRGSGKSLDHARGAGLDGSLDRIIWWSGSGMSLITCWRSWTGWILR
jgi:hypothetical protein